MFVKGHGEYLWLQCGHQGSLQIVRDMTRGKAILYSVCIVFVLESRPAW